MRNASFGIWFPSCISALLQSDFKNRQCVTPSRKNKTLQKFAQSAIQEIFSAIAARERRGVGNCFNGQKESYPHRFR